MADGQIMTGMDERVPVLFVGPEGCRIAPRNAGPKPGEILVDHVGLQLQVKINDIVRASVDVLITGVESIGPDVAVELYTTWQGKRYRMIEAGPATQKVPDVLSIKPTFNLP